MTHAGPSPLATPELFAQAAAALNRGDGRQASELASRLLQREPAHPEAHFIAGLAARELRQMPQALEHLHRAASTRPGHAPYAVHFARALAETFRIGEALQVANVASALVQDDAQLLNLLGNVYTKCNAHERAMSAFRRAAGLAPANAGCRFNFGTSLLFVGEADQAEAEFEACLALAPEHWRAHGILSRIRRQTAQHNHLDRLTSLVGKADGHPFGLMQVHVALSKEYEDLGDYPKAFEHLVVGKSAGKATMAHATECDEAIVDALIRAIPEPRTQPAGHLSDEPIFVMGMPRSGTTLVERILSSHPEVYSAGELANFGMTLKRMSGVSAPMLINAETVDRARDVSRELLGEHYLASTRPATSMKPRFIDKFPHNFLYAGFIADALPNATMICLRRNPLDTCLSNFREPFSEASPLHAYSFDLLDTGRYYILFDRLMAHWRRVFPGRILELSYESLVDNQAACSRLLLEHCGLPWNDACLHFERNLAPATTASSLQVRESIHRTAVHRWKKYEAQLAPLRELLENAGIDCDQT